MLSAEMMYASRRAGLSPESTAHVVFVTGRALSPRHTPVALAGGEIRGAKRPKRSCAETSFPREGRALRFRIEDLEPAWSPSRTVSPRTLQDSLATIRPFHDQCGISSWSGTSSAERSNLFTIGVAHAK